MWRGAYPVFQAQEGVASRRQLLRVGLTSGQIDAGIRSGKISALLPGVYALAGVRLTPLARLIAACLARPRTVVSHQSAGALWGLLAAHPPVPTLSAHRGCRPAAGDELVIHLRRDLTPDALSNWQGFVCTNPLRTLIDLATVLAPPALDRAVDVGLQRNLVTPSALVAEAHRVRRRGRRGCRALVGSLEARGLIGAPAPSVLESLTARLLHRGAIEVLGTEVRVDGLDGRYRLDVLLAAEVALEVDGYAYHGRAADLRRDLHRMNDLQMAGLLVLRFTWWDVVNDPDRVLTVVRRALAKRSDRMPAA